MPEKIVFFEDFVLSRSACELRRGGTVVPLQRIPFEVLGLLVERQGQVVTRQEILERVWGKGVFVDIENAINTALRKIRRALGDHPEEPRFVLTVPARGYRFVAQIRRPKTSNIGHFRARGLDTMVGRERELAELSAGLNDGMGGDGRLFLISGEPGVGKTRLADEVAAVAGTRRMRVLVGHCSDSDEAVAYLPFVEILEIFVGGTPNLDGLRAALGDQGSELARLLPKLKNLLPELPPPLELPPAQAQRHLFNCFCDFVARVCREQPALMILEDLHWADDATLTLLDHLTKRLSDMPLMMICTYRDADLNVTRGLAKTLEDLLRGRLATRLRLKGLTRDEVAAMLNSLSGKSTPAPMVDEVFAETKGNPFFVEELFRYLEEENRLYDSSGQFRSALELGEVEAPPSVRLVVARRLERLSGLTRKMLATAAVIGRSFSLELLQASSDVEATSLEEAVEEAEKAGLLLLVAEGEIPRTATRWQFSHELVRQSVIGALSAVRRQRLHLEVAGAIERTRSTTLDDYYGELAHHFRLGGNLHKAIDYLARAAQQAAARSAQQQAIGLATTGLELLAAVPNGEHHDRHELALQMTLGQCSAVVKGGAAPETERAYTRALELCSGADQTPAAIKAMVGLYICYSRGVDYERSWTLQAQMLELAPTLANPGLRAVVHLQVGVRLLWHGDFEGARYQLEQVLGLNVGVGFRRTACAALALVMWNLGYPVQAAKLIRESEARGELCDPYNAVMVADYVSMVHLVSKDAPAARRYAEVVANLSTQYGFAGELAVANMVRGWSSGWGGDLKGLDLMRESFVAFVAAEGELTHSWICGMIAELCLKFGRHDEAVAALEEALAYKARTGEGFAEAEIYRLKGEAELRAGSFHFGIAVELFQQAIDAARKHSARIAELRATANLARLLSKQGRRDNARAMLAEIYNWFTEGFDTADLKDAKALLDELASGS